MAKPFAETLYKGYAQTFAVSGEMLVDEQTPFQRMHIFDTPMNGRVLALDGIVQLSDRDENVYSEMLSHLPILELCGVRRVLIAGGGDGAIAEEVLKHKSIESVDLVEIDGHVVEASKKHFAHVSGAAFGDPRLNVRIEDAFEFLKEVDPARRYDLIITDRPDPVGPAQVLFATEFYAHVKRALVPRGVAVFQNGVPFYQDDELAEARAQMSAVFRHHGLYLIVVPTYVGGFLAVTWASDETQLGGTATLETLAARFEQSAITTDYYTPEVHLASFALPAWVRRKMTR